MSLQKKLGFTLVELAIVMTIIGLLIGGILKGQTLLENARLTAVIAQVKNFEAATSGFRDKYGTLPGDGLTVVSMLPSCTAPNCLNGDGNGYIGDPDIQWHEGIAPSFNSEHGQFWRHLALGGFISGIDTGVSINGLNPFGTIVPAARIGGGFFVSSHGWGNLGPGTFSGIKVLLRKDVAGMFEGCRYDGNCPLTPGQAAQLDRKMDDGIAALGRVRSMSSTGSCDPQPTVVGITGYDEAVTQKACETSFKID